MIWFIYILKKKIREEETSGAQSETTHLLLRGEKEGAKLYSVGLQAVPVRPSGKGITSADPTFWRRALNHWRGSVSLQHCCALLYVQ